VVKRATAALLILTTLSTRYICCKQATS